MSAVAETRRPRRAKASPIFRNVCCHRCGASGVLDSRDCPRCGGSGFTRGPEHRGVVLNTLSPPERNLRDPRRVRAIQRANENAAAALERPAA